MLAGAAALALGALAAAVSASGCSRPRSRPSGGAMASLGSPIGMPDKPADKPAAESDPIVVVSYNMLFAIPGDEDTLAALRSAQADIAVLQEITRGWERALRDRMADRYPHMLFHAGGRAEGYAVLSRWPLTEGDLLRSPVGFFPAGRVLIDTPAGRVQLFALHLRPPVSDRSAPFGGLFTTGKDRRKEVEAYWAHADPDLPTLAAGDFNEDRSGGAVGFLREQGLTSALPAVDPDATTWRWDTPNGQIRWQLDHVMFDGRFELKSAEVIQAGNSDHLPVVARLRLRSRPR